MALENCSIARQIVYLMLMLMSLVGLVSLSRPREFIGFHAMAARASRSACECVAGF